MLNKVFENNDLHWFFVALLDESSGPDTRSRSCFSSSNYTGRVKGFPVEKALDAYGDSGLRQNDGAWGIQVGRIFGTRSG